MGRRGIFCTENGAALFTRMQVVEDVTGGTLQQVVDETVAPSSKIECDGYRSYKNLSGVALDEKKYEPGDLHWLHKAISNLKAFLLGTYHGRCTQLQAYLDEFCFRFNRRKTGDQNLHAPGKSRRCILCSAVLSR